jgi:pimeloyl-ACP methyl ester carboxylesterase
MNSVSSKDGTVIAYDKQGQGAPVILVAGAMCARLSWSGPQLSEILAPHFTVYNYDRRGRGDSGDHQPYAVQREIEDIQALIAEAGGTACLYGHSSGGALVLHAAASLGNQVKKLAVYEVPYNDDPQAQRAWAEYIRNLTNLLAANRRGDAVALFMKYVGTPDEQIEGMRKAPFWPSMEGIAPTLAYDHTALLGNNNAIPTALAARVSSPVLVMSGDAGLPFMPITARSLIRAIPQAELRILPGQKHDVDSKILAPILQGFFEK